MYSRIKSICALRGTNVKALESKLGLSFGTIAHWKTSSPRAETLAQVAQELGVTMEYLLTGNNPPEMGGLSEEEMEIIRLYQSASPATREAMLQLLRSLEARK